MARPVSTRTCSTPGCERKHCARGLCRRCYGRVWDKQNRHRRRQYDNERYAKDREAWRAYYEANRDDVLARNRAWKQANDYNAVRRSRYRQARDEAWAGHLRRMYGLTPADVERMEREQQGKCGICGAESKLVIDHCHETGRVRGLLCQACNRGLGSFKDDLDRIKAAAAWLA